MSDGSVTLLLKQTTTSLFFNRNPWVTFTPNILKHFFLCNKHPQKFINRPLFTEVRLKKLIEQNKVGKAKQKRLGIIF